MNAPIVKLFGLPQGYYCSFLARHCNKIPKRNPLNNALNTRGAGKYAVFDHNHNLSQKRYETGP